MQKSKKKTNKKVRKSQQSAKKVQKIGTKKWNQKVKRKEREWLLTVVPRHHVTVMPTDNFSTHTQTLVLIGRASAALCALHKQNEGSRFGG